MYHSPSGSVCQEENTCTGILPLFLLKSPDMMNRDLDQAPAIQPRQRQHVEHPHEKVNAREKIIPNRGKEVSRQKIGYGSGGDRDKEAPRSGPHSRHFPQFRAKKPDR
jgi:hypothetical protein